MGSEQAIAAADAGPARYPLTVRDFLMLHEAGAFDGLGRVELIEGETFIMAPLYFPHVEFMPI